MKRVLVLMPAMLIMLALPLVATCSGPKPKPESPIVEEGSNTPESCCCKTFPLTSEDGKAVYAMTGRMECSTQHGDCVPDVQCHKSAQPE